MVFVSFIGIAKLRPVKVAVACVSAAPEESASACWTPAVLAAHLGVTAETEVAAFAGILTFSSWTVKPELLAVKLKEPTFTSFEPATTFASSGDVPAAWVSVPVPTVMVWSVRLLPIVTELPVERPVPPEDVSITAIQLPTLEPDLMLPTRSIVLVAETATSKLTENELSPDAGEGFAVPIWTPVALSTRRRSVMDAASSAERVTTIVFTFVPSVEPAERVNEPRRALLVPAIIVWLP